MHWIAAWRGLCQLISAPFRWEKTPRTPRYLETPGGRTPKERLCLRLSPYC